MATLRTGPALVLACSLAIGAPGCDDEANGEAAGTNTARDFDAEECASCGMIVREQPSPRAQVVHRDGTRAYFCAIADLLAYLEAPSPHGDAVSVYVETLDPSEEDPIARHVAKRPWEDARTASYVVDIERPRIMGTPVLVYSNEGDATSVATRLEGRVLDFDQLTREIP